MTAHRSVPKQESDRREVESSPRWRTVDWLFALGALAWVLWGWGVMPRLITLAYDGAGFAPLVALMDGHRHHPEARFLARWYDVAASGLLIWGWAWLWIWPRSRRYLEGRIIGRATPTALGLIRAFVGAIAIYYALQQQILAVASWPGVERKPMGVMSLFYAAGLDVVVGVESLALGFQACTVIALVLATVGWRTRWSLPVAAVLYLALLGVVRSYTWFNHTGLIPFYILAVLSFTRCGDGFSLDRWQAERRGWQTPPAHLPAHHYAWGRYAVWMAIALPYVAAGFSKLRNGTWFWWDSVNMQAIVFNQIFTPEVLEPAGLATLRALPPAAFAAMGLLTILTEIGMGLVLVSRFWRRWLPLATIAMHFGVMVVMAIEFWDLILLQLVFFDWDVVYHRWRFRGAADRQGQAGTAGRGAEQQAPRFPWLRRAGIWALASVLIACWALRIEFYPLTAMQMFSGYQGQGTIVYAHPYRTDSHGNTTVVSLREMGVPSRGYRRLLQDGFGDAGSRQVLQTMLRELGQRHNRSLPPEERIHSLSVVLYEWDYVNRRDDEAYGEAVDRIEVSLDTSADRP